MTQIRNTRQIWNHGGLEIRNFLVWLVGGDPSSPSEGMIWWDTVLHRARVRTNSASKTLAHLDEVVTPVFGTATTSAVGDSATAGSGSQFARDNHVHGREAFGGTPPASAVGDAGAAGTATTDARSDHKHPREAFAAPTAETAFGTSSAAGTATTLPRADHTHGNPTHVGSDHSSISLSSLSAPTGNLAIGSNKLTGVSDPTASQDAATKAYVDATAAGIDWKASVRVATAAALPAYTRTANVITASANGALAAVDGVTLVAADRLLLKDGAAGADNGLYAVTTVGDGSNPYVLTRTTDADTSAEVTAGTAVFVEEGTANADTGWVLTTNQAITLNTTALTFTQFTGLGQVTAGNGLTKTGSTLDVGAGTGISVAADSVAIDTTLTARYKTFTIGDGAATTFALTHSLGRKIVSVTVSDTTDDSQWDVGVTFTSTTVVTLDFGATVPTSSQFSVLVIG